MAITVTNPEEYKKDWVRRIEFESKEVTLDPIYFRIVDDGQHSTTLVKSEIPTRPRASRPVPIDYKTRASEGSTS